MNELECTICFKIYLFTEMIIDHDQLGSSRLRSRTGDEMFFF